MWNCKDGWIPAVATVGPATAALGGLLPFRFRARAYGSQIFARWAACAKHGHSAVSITFSSWDISQPERAQRLRGRRSARSHDRKIMAWKTQAPRATLRPG